MTDWDLLIIISIGIISFAIPLLLSLKYDLGTKLSKGEVRKSIVISFTVIYIILLLLSFDKTTDLATTNNVTSTITTFNATAQTVPIQAIGNFTQNFLYVYIVIIGFYFGSRLGEQVKMLKELSNIHSLDIVRRRYAMGEIDFDALGKMSKDLKETPLEIAQKRFAKGDINLDTFKEIKRELEETPQESDKNE